MRKFKLTSLLLAVLLLSLPARGQPGTIEEIHVQGLLRMTQAAFRHAFEIREGDAYDLLPIRRQFQRLWDLGLFEDISIHAEDGPGGGKVLVIKVQERPVLTAVSYDEGRVINRTQIDDTLREREVELGLGKPLDLKAISDAEAVIRDLLGQKGYLNNTVEATITEVTKTSRAVHFIIRPGGKTRIRKIDFVENEVFKDRKLKQQLELTKAYRWYWPWSKKNLYHPLKWDQDIGKIRELYQNSGYLDVEVRAPVVEVLESKKKKNKKQQEIEADAQLEANGATEPEVPERLHKKLAAVEQQLERDDLTPKQRRKLREKQSRLEKKIRKKQQKARTEGGRWIQLTVPINEGQQYTMGQVSVSGNSVLKEDQILGLIPVGEGAIFNNGLLDLGIDAITRSYENRGHLYANVVRRIERREQEAVADVQVQIQEDKPYHVGIIEFEGNTATQDRVLRRELLLKEGELFDRTKLDISRSKINQLGFIENSAEPVVEPIEGENRVRVKFGVEERGRNEIQIGGGYSGLDGAFFSGVYSTRNFLGRGQILSVALQVGGRSNRYQLSLTEPWFLNRPYTLGFSVFRRDVDFGATLQSTSEGGGVLFGRLLGTFSNFALSYNYESVTSTGQSVVVGGSTVTSSADNKISSLTPIFRFNKINNPYRPNRGKQFTLSMQVAGGPLGGDTAFLKPIFTFTGYRRALGRTYLGFNTRLGMVTEWQDGSPENSANVNGVPRFQRFWLGGDTLGPRVFETRTITPLRFVIVDDSGRIVEVLGDPRYVPVADLINSNGTPVLLEVGGDRFYLFQAELVYPLNQQVELALFVDAGDALFEDTSINFDTMRVSAGLELRFHLPVIPVPLRLIYGFPLRQLSNDRTSNFQFSIGRSF